MPDVLTPEQRHKNMSHIRSTGTKPEQAVRSYLFAHGFRYRKNVRSLPGCPDVVLPKYRTVIFVNGCFWHHHDCGGFVLPATNREFWQQKIERNVERDKKVRAELEAAGWRVLTVWECELKKAVREERLERLTQEIRQAENA
ncbi:MAG: DNA mismatch endonuclease Vsr [Proteobacteria bacterium]|uniref:Very short patch repair endonuclease n=1 Tax=Candidatus Avisuccinivibrio stercorigallinarum TaxID=2840704 RepID=A0A9D9DB71_9GAMM|nr:DNA mismatch endonuclease Vsr [Candidatus Avisuccinivibrio stercorigallinarum]